MNVDTYEEETMDKRIGRHYKSRRTNGDDKKSEDLFEKSHLAKKAEGRSENTLLSYESSLRLHGQPGI